MIGFILEVIIPAIVVGSLITWFLHRNDREPADVWIYEDNPNGPGQVPVKKVKSKSNPF